MSVFITKDFAIKLRQRLENPQGKYKNLAWELAYQAECCMAEKPLSVTQFKSSAISQNPHDFYSEGKYEWPDPKNPDGPYITRDGLDYPGRFLGHRSSLEKTTYNMLCLAAAGYYLHKPEYTAKAARLAQIWFLNSDTKMNPNMDYAQAVKGKCHGRGIGIIDCKTFIKVICAADLFRFDGVQAETIEGLRGWFGEFLVWLTTSKNGLDEKAETNNHMSWWTVQTMAYSIFTGNKEIFDHCAELFKTRVLGQMNDHGSFDRELERSRSYSYSMFNLQAMSFICEMAHNQGVDLWRYKTPEGKTIERAVRFAMPYVDNPFSWPGRQIKGEELHDELSLRLAAFRLDIPECQQINEGRQVGYRLMKDDSMLGPIALLPEYDFN